jgi:hypothetical protein
MSPATAWRLETCYKQTKSRQDFPVAAIDDGACDDGARRIIPFPTRAGIHAPTESRARERRADSDSPVSDLTRFERTQDGDNYRHRMLVNAAALAVTVVLVAAGVWIAESMASLRRNQDCVLTGRRSCAQVTVSPSDRWSANAAIGQRR